jgi:hypothetical protein
MFRTPAPSSTSAATVDENDVAISLPLSDPKAAVTSSLPNGAARASAIGGDNPRTIIGAMSTPAEVITSPGGASPAPRKMLLSPDQRELSHQKITGRQTPLTHEKVTSKASSVKASLSDVPAKHQPSSPALPGDISTAAKHERSSEVQFVDSFGQLIRLSARCEYV